MPEQGQQDARSRLGLERRALRLRGGFRTQGGLAERAGLSVDTLVSAEQGRTVTTATIEAIAAALRIPPAQYLDPVGYEGAGLPVQAVDATR